MRRARGGAERGTVTLWILGLACCTLPLGGLGVDLGRAVSARRALAATADAAALAGAGALDEARYRASGAVALDPGAAAARARESAAAQDDRAGLRTVTVDADPARVTVTVTGTVDLTLLRLVRGGRPFVVRVEATARPHLLPCCPDRP